MKDAIVAAVLVAACWGIGLAVPSLDHELNDGIFVEGGEIEQPIVIVRVDEATDEAYLDRPLLLWDELHAQVLDAAVAGGAERVAFDFLMYSLPGHFIPSWGFPLTSSMAAARSAGTDVVSIAAVSGDGTGEVRVLGPHRMVQVGSSAVALAHVTVDGDGLVRRMELGCEEPFALAKVLAGGAGDPCESLSIRYLRTEWPGPSMVEVLQRKDDVAWLKEQFAGKTVLVGATAPKFGDLFRTPLGITPGVEIHAHALRTLLAGDAPRPLPLPVGVLVALVLGAGALRIGRTLGATPAAAAVGALLVLLGGVAIIGASALGMRMPFTAWGLSLVVPAAAGSILRAGAERAARQQLAKTLGSYVNPHVLAAVEANPDAAGIGGAARDVTVLMADIQGYTTFAEEHPPETVVAVLNTYFERMTRVVQEHGGTVDKFMGDGMMAVFGAPLPLDADGAPAAVAAARDMERALEGLQEEWRASGLPELEIGIGVHSGPGIVGNMGSALKMEYTVIGDAVNVAARIESSTRKFGVRTLISGDVVDRLPDGLDDAVDLGEVQVKGRTRPVRMWSLAPLSPHDR